MKGSIRAMVKSMYEDQASMMDYMIRVCGTGFTTLDAMSENELLECYNKVVIDYNEGA
jgi:hypothetical protein